MKYPIGIQNFEKLRTGGFAYVDKTAILYQLASQGSYYFLSRPRRFGKSLFLSTLRYYFEGRRDLFEGLAVEKLEKEWEQFPILYLDLNARDYVDETSLHAELNRHLEAWEKEYGDEFRERATEERFLQIIKKVHGRASAWSSSSMSMTSHCSRPSTTPRHRSAYAASSSPSTASSRPWTSSYASHSSRE